MGKMKQSITTLAAFAVLIVLVVATLVWKTGYSIPEMDWDSDGETSLKEMLRAIDVGRRPTKRNGVECQEFFSLKDGLPVRLDCPNH